MHQSERLALQGLKSILSDDESANIGGVHAHLITVLNQYDRIKISIPTDSGTLGKLGLASFMSSPHQTISFPLKSGFDPDTTISHAECVISTREGNVLGTL